jgi:hypothetical protein
MAVIDVTVAEMEEFAQRSFKSKFPWDEKKVGEGFFVSEDDVKHRPVPPPRLVRAGQKWKTAKGTHPTIDKSGFFCVRLK